MEDALADALSRVVNLRNRIKSSQMNEVLPFLYLGSLSDSLSVQQLENNDIKIKVRKARKENKRRLHFKMLDVILSNLYGVSVTIERAIVTIREDHKPSDSHSQLRVHFVQLCDQPTENISAYFKDVAIFIHSSRIRKEAVLVHCLAGISRSATIVAAYLMIVCNLTSYNALSYISARRPKINPNFGFRMQLCKFENSAAKRDREELIQHFGNDIFEKQYELDQIETRGKYITQCNTDLALSKSSSTKANSANLSSEPTNSDSASCNH